jgi:hypothetical protein
MRPLIAAFQAALLVFAAAATPLPARAAQPIVHWLLVQTVQSCFPWFLAGIGPTNVVFDPRDVNKGRGPDQILDAGFLALGTLIEVGPDRLRVVYDPTLRVALFDHTFASGSEEYVVSNVAPPPAAVVHANLGGVETERRLRLGTAYQEVLRKNGSSPRSVRRCGLQAIVYQIPGRHCLNERDYVFKDRRLIAFAYGGDC